LPVFLHGGPGTFPRPFEVRQGPWADKFPGSFLPFQSRGFGEIRRRIRPMERNIHDLRHATIVGAARPPRGSTRVKPGRVLARRLHRPPKVRHGARAHRVRQSLVPGSGARAGLRDDKHSDRPTWLGGLPGPSNWPGDAGGRIFDVIKPYLPDQARTSTSSATANRENDHHGPAGFMWGAPLTNSEAARAISHRLTMPTLLGLGRGGPAHPRRKQAETWRAVFIPKARYQESFKGCRAHLVLDEKREGERPPVQKFFSRDRQARPGRLLLTWDERG